MADRYLYAAAATHTAPYTDPDTPAETLDEILALTGGDALLAGEIIWVHASHVEVSVSGFRQATTSTINSPHRVLCVNNFTDKALSSGAQLHCNPSFNHSYDLLLRWYMHGISIACGGNQYLGINHGAVAQNHIFTGKNLTLKTANNAATRVLIGQFRGNLVGSGLIVLDDCIYDSGNAGSVIYLSMQDKYINNLTVTGTVPTTLFGVRDSATGTTEITNSDFSGLAYTNLVKLDAAYGDSGDGIQTIKFINCKLRSGSTNVTGWQTAGSKIYLINCDYNDTNHRWELHQYQGTIKIDTGIYATTTPANYETSTPYSIRMDASANASRYLPLQSEWVHKWYESGTHTLDVECLVGEDDAAALKDFELYLEVDYISGANSPLGSRATTAPNILNAGTDNPAGTTAWTGDGYAVERTHKLSTSVTSSKNGYIRYRVCLAKPSTTVYFNPV